jgi:hypothetical protein
MKSGTKVPALLSPTPEVCFDVVELLCIGKVDKVWRSPDRTVIVHVKFHDGGQPEYELPKDAAELRVVAVTQTTPPADETIRITELETGRAADDDMPDDAAHVRTHTHAHAHAHAHRSFCYATKHLSLLSG